MAENARKEDVVDEYLEETLSTVANRTPEGIAATYKSVLSLATLLKVNREAALSRMLLKLTFIGEGVQAVAIAKQLQDKVQVAGLLTEMNQAMADATDSSFGVEADAELLPSVLCSLASQAVVNADEDGLPVATVASRWQRLLKVIHERFGRSATVSGALSAIDRGDEQLARWRLSSSVFPVFRDKGLPLSGAALKTAVACASVAGTSGSDDAGGTLLRRVRLLKAELDAGSHLELGLATAVMASDAFGDVADGVGEEREQLRIAVASNTAASVRNLMTKVLAEKRPDFNLALAYLLAEKNGLKSLNAASNEYGLDFPKLASVARLGLHYCTLRSILPPIEDFRQLLLRSVWGRHFSSSELKVPFKEAFVGGKREQQAVLDSMIEQLKRQRGDEKYATVANLVKYCDAFDLNRTDALLQYVRAALSTLEPSVSRGGEEVARPEGLDETLSKVEDALSHIGDQAVVDDAMVELFKDVSPYNYEVLGFIIERLDRTAASASTAGSSGGDELVRGASQVLGFALQYERRSEPSEYETDLWLESTSSSEGTLPFPYAVARRRLPLSWLAKLPQKQKFKLVRKELTLDSVHLWVNASRMLRLQPDNICILAVQNALAERFGNGTGSGAAAAAADDAAGWCLSRVHGAFLSKIKTCIDCISNLEKAASCAHYVVGHLPGGADKVEWARTSQRVAETWHVETLSVEAERGLGLAVGKLAALETEDVLHRRQLAERQHLELVHKGAIEELLMKLYEHPRCSTLHTT